LTDFEFSPLTDSGSGIDDNDVGHVFERFYQSNRAFQEQQGAGLGLALVSEIVHIHGGNCWLES
jgi:signal transduction histidine kinase